MKFDGRDTYAVAKSEAEDAMRSLSEDFGSEFVNMILAIASMKAAEVVNEILSPKKVLSVP